MKRGSLGIRQALPTIFSVLTQDQYLGMRGRKAMERLRSKETLDVSYCVWANLSTVRYFVARKGVRCLGMMRVAENMNSVSKLALLETWVHPDFRRQGIYSTFWSMAKEHARQIHCSTIEGATASLDIAEVMERQDRVLHTRVYRFRLDDVAEETMRT